MNVWQEFCEAPWFAKAMVYVAFAAVLFGIVNEFVRAS